MEEHYYKTFLEKYLENRHTEEEHRLFIKWFTSISVTEAQRVMDQYIKMGGSSPFLNQPDENALLIRRIEAQLDELDNNENEPTIRQSGFWGHLRPFAAAAILVLVGAAGYYVFNSKEKNEQIFHEPIVANDILPGGNKAILTLADGSTINLNEANDGEIAKQSGTQISKISDGQLAYVKTVGRSATHDPENINLVRTPKAGQYRINLSDGTKVWLNSLSSIKFPAVFSGDTRKVEITGEAYFEVASHRLGGKKTPFIVMCKNQRIEVTGTHFNVNSYRDETSVKTTLLEGSVNVSAMKNEHGEFGSTVRLKPGEQSILKQHAGKSAAIAVEKADTESAIAWKEGYFKFKDTDIQEVMRQLSRWYDLEVTYDGALPKDEFTGYVSKKVTVSNILSILEEGGGVKFRISGKKVEVSAYN